MTQAERELYLYEKGEREKKERELAEMRQRMAQDKAAAAATAAANAESSDEEERPRKRSKRASSPARKHKSSKTARRSKTGTRGRRAASESESESEPEPEPEQDSGEDYEPDAASDSEYDREIAPSDIESGSENERASHSKKGGEEERKHRHGRHGDSEEDDDEEQVPSGLSSEGEQEEGARDRRDRRDRRETYRPEEDVDFEAMKKLQLRRAALVMWANEPFFAETVQGFYVRIGWKRRGGVNCYVMARVAGVREREAPYEIERRALTDRLLVLHNPAQASDRDTKISLVSNGEITRAEFDEYQRHAQRAREYVCRVADVPAMVDRIEAAKAHVHTEAEVRAAIEKAQRFRGNAPLNVEEELCRARAALSVALKTHARRDPAVRELVAKVAALRQKKAEIADQRTESARRLRENALWYEKTRVASAGPAAGAQASFRNYSSRNNALFLRLPTRPTDPRALRRVEQDLQRREAEEQRAKALGLPAPADAADAKTKAAGASAGGASTAEDPAAALLRAQEKRRERILQEDWGTRLRRLHDFELDLTPQSSAATDDASAAAADAAATSDAPSTSNTSAAPKAPAAGDAGDAHNTLFQSLTADDDDAMTDGRTITFSQYLALCNSSTSSAPTPAAAGTPVAAH